jgi:hypothetical protein
MAVPTFAAEASLDASGTRVTRVFAVPRATATATVYRATAGYVGVGSGIVRRPFPTTQCDLDYADCVAQADAAYEQRTWLCVIAPTQQQQQACYQQAAIGRTQAIAACQARGLLCGPGETCQPSPVPPGNWRCCPTGYQACGGAVPACVPDCPPGKVIAFGDASCTCVCAPPLGGCPFVTTEQGREQMIQDPVSCQCACPRPCPPGYLQDPATCACSCPPGQKDCGYACVTLGTPANCSDCGDQCLLGNQLCCNGQCEWIHQDTRCGDCVTDCTPSGRICCHNLLGVAYTCVDQMTDHYNCGRCGRQCSSKHGFVCQGGQCVCAPGTTPCGPEICCQGTCCNIGGMYGCSDLDDEANCGACGHHCTLNERCCPQPGGGRHCLNVQTDPANCGSCGHACAANQRCCPPPGGGPGHCADTQTDDANCGTCGHACPTGWGCCAGTCVDFENDPHNCGNCAWPCSYYDNQGSGAFIDWGSCAAGLCRCPTGWYGVGITQFGDERCCLIGYVEAGNKCCPASTPVLCASGGCAATQAACPP